MLFFAVSTKVHKHDHIPTPGMGFGGSSGGGGGGGGDICMEKLRSSGNSQESGKRKALFT